MGGIVLTRINHHSAAEFVETRRCIERHGFRRRLRLLATGAYVRRELTVATDMPISIMSLGSTARSGRSVRWC